MGYTDENGERKTVYSWKLVETRKLKEEQRGQESLREKKFFLKCLDYPIRATPSLNAFKYFAKINDVMSKLREALTTEPQERFIGFAYSSHIYRRLENP